MAQRPVFIASLDNLCVAVHNIEFTWYPGYSISQKQKSIFAFHANIIKQFRCMPLEVSSKSPLDIGVKLSAFNLKTTTLVNGNQFSVESAFQGSKVFMHGGPFSDLIFADSRIAKKDSRLKQSGALKSFSFFKYTFNLKPRTLFYDWLYINTLLKNKHLITELLPYTAFTDIEFNPNKSINCQAFSLALFRTLFEQNLIQGDTIAPPEFERITKPIYDRVQRILNIQTML